MRKQLLLGLLPVIAAFACSSSGSDNSLLGGTYSPTGAGTGSAGGPSSSTATGTSNGSMPTSSGGSTGASSGGTTTGSSSSSATSPTSDDGGLLPDASALADGGSAGRAMFEALLPTFDTSCGGPCHQQGLTNAPPYLGGADAYTTIKTYAGMIAPTAAQSILLTKGQHEGPPLADPLKTSLTNWLTVEAASLVASGPASTTPVTPASGANTIDLSSVGVAGASLTFSAAIAGDIVTLSSLTITAPAATGVQVVYPIFYAAGGTTTENDDLSNVDQTIAAGATATVGTGLLILTGWAATDTISVTFKKLVAASASDAGLSGGCKSVATFTTNAVPAIQNNTCLNCHNTGGSGNASLDLSGLAANPPNDTAACAQALARVNTANPAQSDIILAPTGGVANHPFKTANANYTTMMETWISAEK